MSTAVQKAIEAAQQQGANASQALATTGPTAVASYQAPAAKMTLDDLDSGLSVDGFIQPKFEGLTLKMQDDTLSKGASIIDEVFVTINLLQDVQVFTGAKYGNKPTTYIKTFDGHKEARGGLWETALAKAKLADPTVYTYQGADMEFTIAQDVKDVKGKTVALAGTTLGHSSTPTGLKNIKKFLKAVEVAGLKSETILVKITNEPRSDNGNNWGVLNFELIGKAPEQAD